MGQFTFHRELFANVKITNLFLFTVALLFIGVYIIFSFYALQDGKLYPRYFDENLYIASSKIFYEATSLKAPFSLNEERSRILLTHWYGPWYHIIYGAVAKIFNSSDGFHIVFMNIIFVFLSLLFFIVFLKTNYLDSILVITFFLGSYCLLLTFSYFPEMMIVFWSTLLSILLFNYYKDPENKTALMMFLLSLIIAITFRITFLLWFLALLPQSNNLKSLVKNLGLVVLGVLFTVLYVYFFNAKYTAGIFGSLSRLQVFNFSDVFQIVITYVFSNLKVFLSSYSDVYFIVINIVIFFFISYLYVKDKLILAISLVIISHIIITITLYVLEDYYLMRQLSIVLPLLVLGVIYSKSISMKLLVLSILIFFLPIFARKTLRDINTRKEKYEIFNVQQPEIKKSFSEIKNIVDPYKDNIVLLYWPEHGHMILSHLPYTNISGYTITYTSNMERNDLVGNDEEEIFKRYNKMKIDYILSKNELRKIKNIELIKKTRYFHLYKLLDNTR